MITGSGSNDPQKDKKKQTSREIQQRSIKNQDEKNQARRLTQGAGGQKNLGTGKGSERVTGGSKKPKITTYQNIIKKAYDDESGVRSDMAGDKIANPEDVKKITQTTKTPKDLKGKEIANPLFQKIDQASLTGTGSESRSKADRSDEARQSYNKLQQDARKLAARDRAAQRKGFVDYDDMLQQRKKDKPKPRKPRTIPFKDKTQLDPETQKKVDAVTPPFATKQGETGPLPVSMRNRRVPKTSSLSPNVKVTSIVKPKVGALAKTDQETSAITKGQIDYKALQDTIRTVTPDEVISPKGDPLKVNQPKEGPTINMKKRKTQTQTGRRTRTGTPTKTDIKKLKPPKIYGYIAPPDETPVGTPPDEPTTDDTTPPIPPNKKTKVGNFSYRPGGAFSRIRGFARKNPALSLIGYDALRNLQAPRVEKPTRTGRVSAGS